MYYFINDPGHGWLRVPKTELRHLNIERKISSYSYQSKLYAYLEEDCDLKTFLDAKNIGTNGTWEEKQKAYKIFWDNRANLYETNHVSKDGHAIRDAKAGWKELLRIYEIRTIIIPENNKALARALSASNEWKQVFKQPGIQIFTIRTKDGGEQTSDY